MMILQNTYQKHGSFIFLSMCFFFQQSYPKLYMFDFMSGITFTIWLVVYIVFIMKLFSVLHDCMINVSKLNNFSWIITCAYLEYAKYFLDSGYKDIYFKFKSHCVYKYNQIFILMSFFMFSVYVRCLIVYQIINSMQSLSPVPTPVQIYLPCLHVYLTLLI